MKPNKAFSVAAVALSGAFSAACGGSHNGAPESKYNDYSVNCYDTADRRNDSLKFLVNDYEIKPNGPGAKDDSYTLFVRQDDASGLVEIGKVEASHCDISEATSSGKAPAAENFSKKGGYSLYCTDPDSNKEFLSLSVFKIAASSDNSRYEASLGGEKLGSVDADHCSFKVIKPTASPK